MCGQVCLGLGLAELAVVCFSAAGIAAYTTVAVLGGLAAGQSGLEGICSGTGPCAYEFGIWLIADAAVGLSICWAGIGVCLSTRCTKKPQPLSSGCRARLAVFGATALVVELACTVVGAVLVWHPLRCFQRCSVFTKVFGNGLVVFQLLLLTFVGVCACYVMRRRIAHSLCSGCGQHASERMAGKSINGGTLRQRFLG